MDQPPAKRRRTTPPEERERASSPLKQPPRRPDHGERSSSPLKKPPRRPSFASPTKASISRFNPGLLPPGRPKSAGVDAARPSSRGEPQSRDNGERAFIFGVPDHLRGTEQPVQNDEDAEAGAEIEEQVLSNMRKRSITPRPRRPPRKSRASVPLEEVEEDVEQLTTPFLEQAQEDETTRQELLLSSPSKRPPRSLKEATKPAALRPDIIELAKKAQPTLDHRKGHLTKLNGKMDKEPAISKEKKTVEPPDPELEHKKREKERLLKEVQELESDVLRCTEEINKSRDFPNARLRSAERKDLLSFISKISGSASPSDEDQAPPISNLLSSFLPFANFTIAPPAQKTTKQTPIPSHKPIELDDPLPYLQMFTPFTFTHHMTLPPNYDPLSPSVRQLHTIDIAGPQKLLTASLSILIDALNPQILELDILNLSPWTSHDLAPFIRSKALEKDLSTVCWAFTSYWELAKKRAEFWHRCEHAFAHLIPGRMSEDTENSIRDQGEKRAVPKLTRRDLSRYLGRDVFHLRDEHVVFKIVWRIGFDWTGEAESEVGVEAAVPRVWTEADTKNALKDIPATFQSLFEKMGIFEATKAMVSLLFGDN